MRTIPQIRDRLHELAEEHGIDELAQLAEETRRRSPVRRAPPTLKAVPQAEIRAWAGHFPEASYKEIAEACNTTIGRVSEALAGKRQ